MNEFWHGTGLPAGHPGIPVLQAPVNKWDGQVQGFYANNETDETTGPAVEKTDRLVSEYGSQMEAWCVANAGVNLAGDGTLTLRCGQQKASSCRNCAK